MENAPINPSAKTVATAGKRKTCEKSDLLGRFVGNGIPIAKSTKALMIKHLVNLTDTVGDIPEESGSEFDVEKFTKSLEFVMQYNVEQVNASSYFANPKANAAMATDYYNHIETLYRDDEVMEECADVIKIIEPLVQKGALVDGQYIFNFTEINALTLKEQMEFVENFEVLEINYLGGAYFADKEAKKELATKQKLLQKKRDAIDAEMQKNAEDMNLVLGGCSAAGPKLGGSAGGKGLMLKVAGSAMLSPTPSGKVTSPILSPLPIPTTPPPIGAEPKSPSPGGEEPKSPGLGDVDYFAPAKFLRVGSSQGVAGDSDVTRPEAKKGKKSKSEGKGTTKSDAEVETKGKGRGKGKGK